MEENFIGGHPMAGSEKNGFANSKAHLIENAYYILTPSAKVSEEKINAYRNFVSSLKALPIVLDYRQHDCITGTISHLPHIIGFYTCKLRPGYRYERRTDESACRPAVSKTLRGSHPRPRLCGSKSV